MCDCSEEKDRTSSKKNPETITLFEKCRKPYRPGRDIAIHGIIDDDNANLYAAQPMYFLNHDDDDSNADTNDNDVCDTIPKPPTSESTSESSRTYKFVNTHEHEWTEAEGEKETLSPLSVEPCRDQDEDVLQKPDIECTLAIIKPEAMIYRKQIEQRIHDEGFEIYQTRWLQLTPEQVSEFYSDEYGQLNFAHLVAYMSSGPIIVLVLAKHEAVKDWKFLIGPKNVIEARLYYPDSIRGLYGRRGEDFKNAVHGSDSIKQAEREIHFFFPESVIEPLLKGSLAENYLWETINPILIDGLSMCCKLKPADPILWLANWLIMKNPHKPRLPEDLAICPT